METVSPSYVENSPIYIPHIENGVTNLGDLWNCRSSKAVGGFNLCKGNTIPAKHLKTTPIRNCDYTLTHVKNDHDTAKSLKVEGHLSLDLLAGLIKLEGNLKFRDDSNDESHKEVISCRYINENYRIETILPIYPQINEHVSQLISSGEIEATHVVGGIMIGSSVTALIEISQNESKKDMDISGGGQIDIEKNRVWLNKLIGSFSAEVKANWSEKENSKNYDIKINCKARPMPSGLAPPSSVTQLFELIDKMPTALTTESYFDINDRGICGVPIRFMLYPIAQFARLEIIKMYKSLEDDLIGKFQIMLAKAIEIQQKDYAKKLILMQNKELAFLISKKSVLSNKVREFEGTLKQIGADFANRSREQLGEYKYGKCGPEVFSTIIKDFDASDAGLGSIENKIQELIDEGASEISMANGTDESHVKKFTNDQDKQIWKEDESNPKIILEICPQCSKTVINSYYQLITPLGEIGMKMALVMPSIAKELKLSLIIDNQENIFKDSKTEKAIEILCANFKIGNQARTEFFAVAAAMNGIEFPMRDLSKFGFTLQVMLQLAEYYKHFKFADSVNEFKHLISKLPVDHVAFCVPIDAPETALDLLQTWKDYKIKDVTWIVHSLECNGYQEAPLLFVISKGEVLVVCLDRLDLLILEERIRETDKICDVNFEMFSIDQLSKSFHELRALCAVRFLKRVFPNSAGVAIETKTESEVGEFPSFARSEVVEFLSFARKCLSSNELVILSSVAERVVHDFPNLISTLTKHGWNDRSKLFSESISNNDSGKEMISEIEKWLEDDSLMRKIDQKSVYYKIADHSHCPIGFKLELEKCKSEGCSDSDERVLDMLKELRICDTSTKSNFSFVHVRIFLKALDLVLSSPKQSVDALIKLLIKEYYENMKTMFPDKSIENSVQNKQIYLLLQDLSPYKYGVWMRAFLKGIRTLRHLDDIDTLTILLQELSMLCTYISFSTQLWANGKWLLLVRRCIHVRHGNNFQLLRSVFDWIKKMFSLDMLARILSAVDRACAQDLLAIFSKLSLPLPLIIPDIREENKFIVTLPLLKNIVIGWQFNRLMGQKKSTDGRENTGTKDALENHLFSSPFRLIAAVRIDSKPVGKSRFLNRLVVNPFGFSSDAGANKKSKQRGTLAGTVEFIWLTKETCREYHHLSLDSHYSKNGNEILLLAYLHGNALDFPAVVSYLKKLASCFIVIERLGQDRKTMEKLKTGLSGCPIVHVIDLQPSEKNCDTIMTKAMKPESKWKNLDQSIVEELMNTESIDATESAAE